MVNGETVVADGAPHEIKALAASRRVRCVTSVATDDVRGLTGVQSVRHDGAAIEIMSNDAEGLTRALLNRDPALSGLEITGAGLEDAFLTLTRPSASARAALVAGGVR